MNREVMRVSLIVTTYNWPQALNLTLASVGRQSTPPFEVVVADDGSGEETAAIIRHWQARLTCPVKHVWQQDQGFRLARARNRAIAASEGEYIALVDGDMVLHPKFIADHSACARPDRFIQGARPQLSRAASERMLRVGETRVSVLSRGIGRRSYAIRSTPLSLMFSKARPTLAGIQGCNQSFWRRHAVQVNGYDERFTGWGPEDREFAARLLHIGLQRYYVRHRAIAYHLYHESRAPRGINPFDQLLAETLRTHATRCTMGLDAHLSADDSQRPAAAAALHRR